MKRLDGRAPDELRPVHLELGFVENPTGSCLIRMGRTMVLCTVHLAEQVPGWLRGRGTGWVTAEYSLLPGSTDTRSEREAVRGRLSGRTMEIQRLIGRSLRAVTDLDALGERALLVDCDVLQADGGTRTAAITGAYMALASALRRLRENGLIAADPLRSSVAAVSVGIVDGQVLLDLPYAEDARAQVDLNLVQTGGNEFVEIQGTGESATFDRAQLDSMLELGSKGIAELTRMQQKVLAG